MWEQREGLGKRDEVTLRARKIAREWKTDTCLNIIYSINVLHALYLSFAMLSLQPGFSIPNYTGASVRKWHNCLLTQLTQASVISNSLRHQYHMCLSVKESITGLAVSGWAGWSSSRPGHLFASQFVFSSKHVELANHHASYPLCQVFPKKYLKSHKSMWENVFWSDETKFELFWPQFQMVCLAQK